MGVRVNRKALKIDRIDERSEILAIVRSMTSVLWKPSKEAPEIRGIRYFLFFARRVPPAGNGERSPFGTASLHDPHHILNWQCERGSFPSSRAFVVEREHSRSHRHLGHSAEGQSPF